MNAPLTRKDVAILLKRHVRTIGKNEKLLGLDKARADCGNQRVMYNYESAISILVKRGLLTANPA